MYIYRSKISHNRSWTVSLICLCFVNRKPDRWLDQEDRDQWSCRTSYGSVQLSVLFRFFKPDLEALPMSLSTHLIHYCWEKATLQPLSPFATYPNRPMTWSLPHLLEKFIHIWSFGGLEWKPVALNKVSVLYLMEEWLPWACLLRCMGLGEDKAWGPCYLKEFHSFLFHSDCLWSNLKGGYVTVCFCFSDHPPWGHCIWLFGDVHIWIPI
jgi:hypothetical protein